MGLSCSNMAKTTLRTYLSAAKTIRNFRGTLKIFQSAHSSSYIAFTAFEVTTHSVPCKEFFRGSTRSTKTQAPVLDLQNKKTTSNESPAAAVR